MERRQIFKTAHEAFVILNNYCKHGWHGYVRPSEFGYELILCC